MLQNIRSILIISLLCVYSLSALGEEERSGRAFSVYIENDSRSLGGPGSDQAYSNGIKFTSVYAEDKIPKWAKPFVIASDLLQDEIEKSQSNFALSLGHQIYTPKNIKAANLIKNDRPYAAWLYLGFNAYFKTETHSHSFDLSLGTVGPNAAGEKIQNGYHQLIGTFPAEGWDNELKNEPTVQINYQQRLKFVELFTKKEHRYFDVIPYFGGGLGNVKIDAHAGALLRVGFFIPDDFGPARPSAADGNSFVAPDTAKTRAENDHLGFYGFVGGRFIFVAHDLFLDGNTFVSSHHVKKYPIVNESEFGFGLNWKKWIGVWRFVIRSPEFEERSRFNSFASISITYLFE